ncbi:hypothetical protein PsYK624_115320 [Phanerochaete sordida]|uniref:Uncharacterized protein n=1 Tax=Phanerochaete sordida TaxID=48140 RepID=A0A9P3GI51_9APHY|nr:hypothetical protein PsYK624_115320 [Phanerochaete sordida]
MTAIRFRTVYWPDLGHPSLNALRPLFPAFISHLLSLRTLSRPLMNTHGLSRTNNQGSKQFAFHSFHSFQL